MIKGQRYLGWVVLGESIWKCKFQSQRVCLGLSLLHWLLRFCSKERIEQAWLKYKGEIRTACWIAVTNMGTEELTLNIPVPCYT